MLNVESMISNSKVKLKIEKPFLNSIISFLLKDTTLKTTKILRNVKKLIDLIDEKSYINNPELNIRIISIDKIIEAIIEQKLQNSEFIVDYVRSNMDNCDMFKSVESDINHKITYDECRYVLSKIHDKLQRSWLLILKEKFLEILDEITEDDNKTVRVMEKMLFRLARDIVDIQYKTKLDDESCSVLTLKTELFENTIMAAMEHLNDTSKVLKTGCYMLNEMLGPGYLSKKLYIYLALPGGGKSIILLESLLAIRKFNKHVKPKENGKLPTAVLVLLENQIEETVLRMFNTLVSSDNITNYSAKEAIKKLRKDGELTLTEENNIDTYIVVYKNNSVDADDLSNMIRDLEEDGREVIALIVDYLKRVRPINKGANEKEDLKNITNDFKSLSEKHDIPVITAQQLNRNTSSVVDKAILENKSDIGRYISRDGIANAWEILENADCIIILYKELKSDGTWWMTFKLVKRRYNAYGKFNDVSYFNQPFVQDSTIKLYHDAYDETPAGVLSLASEVKNEYSGIPAKTTNLTNRKIIDDTKGTLADFVEGRQFHLEKPKNDNNKPILIEDNNKKKKPHKLDFAAFKDEDYSDVIVDISVLDSICSEYLTSISDE